MTHELINHYLEKERQIQHLTIKQFVEGVFSERTYRRYINEGMEIPYQKLKKLLLRLSVNPFGFLYSIQATLVAKHPDELDILMSLVDENYSQVNELIDQRDSQPFHTFLGEYAIPIFMNMLDVYNHKQTLETAQANILNKIDIKLFINQTFVTQEPIQALNSFVDIIPKEMLEPLFNVVQNIIKGDYKYHFSMYRLAMANLYSLNFKLIFRMYHENHSKIETELKKTIHAWHYYGLELYAYDVLTFLANKEETLHLLFVRDTLKKYLIPSIMIHKHSNHLMSRIPETVLKIIEGDRHE